MLNVNMSSLRVAVMWAGEEVFWRHVLLGYPGHVGTTGSVAEVCVRSFTSRCCSPELWEKTWTGYAPFASYLCCLIFLLSFWLLFGSQSTCSRLCKTVQNCKLTVAWAGDVKLTFQVFGARIGCGGSSQHQEPFNQCLVACFNGLDVWLELLLYWPVWVRCGFSPLLCVLAGWRLDTLHMSSQ